MVRNILKVSGIIIVLGCIAFLSHDVKKIDTFHNGRINQVKVVFMPTCRSARAHYAMKFEYKGRVYSKEVGGAMCKDLKVGDKIPIRMNQDQTVFLFEKENPYIDMIATGLLLLFGATLFIVGIRTKRK